MKLQHIADIVVYSLCLFTGAMFTTVSVLEEKLFWTIFWSLIAVASAYTLLTCRDK